MTSQPSYPYAARVRDPRVLHLDYNEYWGRIHPELAARFSAEDVARQYALTTPRHLLEQLQDVTRWSGAAPAWATHGADEGILHTLLARRLRQPAEGPPPAWDVAWAPSYEHASAFAAQLGFQTGAEPGSADVVYVCSPNNPTGEIASPASLGGALALGGRPEPWLLVDLTYEDYMPPEARARQAAWVQARLASARPTIAVKSYAKSLPIAGFRFGLVATNVPAVQDHLERVYNRKLVTEAAMHVMQHGLDHRDFYASEQRSIFGARDALVQGLEPLAAAFGVRFQAPPGGNFIVGRGSQSCAEGLHAALAGMGISARLKATPEGGCLLRLTSVAEAYLGEVLGRLREAASPAVALAQA
ncbi:MAG: aminotransferase class I/II-fold pyridoxal phosphate-dependent enzyme [Candidatus Sericytochromatia bacterium]|nr:aminotransferase class I/II-fold pyridoxal phosphate-dependent enzyme [Candidatus Sericytochromatia bacterium]